MFVLNKSTNRLVDTPLGFSDNRRTALPMMSWADWDLLQELHKARNGEGTAITVQFAPPPELSAGYRPDLFPSYDKQYESLARPAGSMSQAAVDAIAKIGGKPEMTWADWDLMQELHKARNGEGTATVQFVAPVTVRVNDLNPELFPSYDKQYESLARPAGGGSPSGHVGGAGGKPAMNWQAVAADLQDQIKDWETKCKQLETRKGDIQAALKGALETANKLATENAELSKSLQHYRNAYFADQGKEGNSDEQE